MSKLSDKQMNILFLGIGIVVLLIFSVMSYLDYGEIEELEKKRQAVKGEIQKATKKKKAVPALTKQLYRMHRKYLHFKKVLPKKRDFIKFYETLENFRIERGIDAWKSFKLVKAVKEGRIQKGKKKPTTTKKKKKPKKRRRRKKGGGGAGFVATNYMANVTMNFDQLGQMLNLIENYERFYGVSSVKMSAALAKKKGGPITLKLVSFSYQGGNPLDVQVKKILKNYVPGPKVVAEIEELEQKVWTRKSKFRWSKPARNPFSKDEVLTIVATDKPTVSKVLLGPPPAQEQLKVQMEKLQETRNFLHMLAVAESWAELENSIKEKQYSRKLTSLRITSTNDPAGSARNKIAEMRKELKEWKILIREANLEEKAKQLVVYGRKKVKEMETFYKTGKKTGSPENLRKAIKIHNEMMPQYKDFTKFESKIPGLATLRKQTEELYSRAETQLKIIQLAKKLNLNGVIYIQNRPELSVAFINKKVVHKNDILMMGFVVHEIQEEGVILRYKEETVPIRLKRAEKLKKQIRQSS